MDKMDKTAIAMVVLVIGCIGAVFKVDHSLLVIMLGGFLLMQK